MPYTTTTLADHLDAARTIVSDLHAAGFTTDAISVVFPRHHLPPGDEVVDATELAQGNRETGQGVAVGAVAGGVVGSALAWLTGVGVIAVPGLAPLLAAGPFLTIFTGMGLGASLGGVAGALVGMGIPEIDAKRFASSISDGRILIAVRSDDEERAQAAEAIMRAGGGQETAHSQWPVDRPRAGSASG